MDERGHLYPSNACLDEPFDHLDLVRGLDKVRQYLKPVPRPYLDDLYLFR
jgi:hypothetical protein